MNTSSSDALDPVRLRGASTCQTLHWLASGRIDATALAEHYLAAIDAASKKMTAAVLDAAEVLTPEQRTELAKDFSERKGRGKW